MKNIKTLFITLILLNSLNLLAYASGKVDYIKYNNELRNCFSENTSNCYAKLVNTYNLNEARYYYAQSLFKEKNYAKAKSEYETILRTEKSNNGIINAAKNGLEQIKQLNVNMRNANNADWGDYYSQLDSTGLWENPRNLRVYVEGKTGKEYILTQAFKTWDNAVAEIGFTYVNSPDNADIICFFVDNLNLGNAAGITETEYNKLSSGVKRLKKATVKIAFYRPGTSGKFTDNNLLCITLHEIGHALGILSHSTNKNDVMYPTTDTYQNTYISKRDMNTIKKMYNN